MTEAEPTAEQKKCEVCYACDGHGVRWSVGGRQVECGECDGYGEVRA